MLNLTNSSLDNYEIIKEIGKGSFSTVYLIKKNSSQKEYALKKVNIIKLNTKERQNSIKEVNFLSEIKDPNVIGYEESFYDNNYNYLYLVMEYAPYGDLGKILQKRKKLKDYYSENELLNMYLQIASGLKAVHAKQIIHRDLKSANIFITQKNDLILKIGDFNVSKKIDYLNLKNTQTGTPYYASPEIWENRPYDFKSDIWSLGCLFYEIASFTTPFKGNNMKELYENIIKGNMAPLPKQYSNNISKIIKLCLRQDANLRPNINDVKFYIENLKLEQHFKKIFDDNIFEINYNYPNNNGFKRQTSYIKQSGNRIFDNNKVDSELDNINFNFKKDYTPIKLSQNYYSHNLTKDKPRIKLAGLLNINLNLINNNIINNKIKENHINSNILKTDNNIINKSQHKEEKKYLNIKLKPPPPCKRLKIINTELEEKIKLKEERKDDNYYKDDFSSKFNNIKNPLIQTNGRSSINNSQSIPEIINNSEFQNQKNEKVQKENNNDIKDNKVEVLEKKEIYRNINIKTNHHYKREIEKEKNLYLKQKFDKDILLPINPNKVGLKKKLNNLSTLNLHKKPITTLLTQNNITNINKKLLKNEESNNKNKNLAKIKLRPIAPSIRSITPFNEIYKKPESINVKKILKYNLSNIKFKSVKDNINETNNISNINNETNITLSNKKNNKKYFLRKLKIDKSKFILVNNPDKIKRNFTNLIKPNFKNFEKNFKTEI